MKPQFSILKKRDNHLSPVDLNSVADGSNRMASMLNSSRFDRRGKAIDETVREYAVTFADDEAIVPKVREN
jgi:hypothetical protein